MNEGLARIELTCQQENRALSLSRMPAYLTPTILDISFHQWNSWEGSFWKHFSYSVSLWPLCFTSLKCQIDLMMVPAFFFIITISGKAEGVCVREAQMRARMDVVAHPFTYWWLRMVSTFSSSWFMDCEWTSKGIAVLSPRVLTEKIGQGKTGGTKKESQGTAVPVTPTPILHCFARQLAVSSFSLACPKG